MGDQIAISTGETIQLCGPMTGYPDLNRVAFAAVETWLRDGECRRVWVPTKLPQGHSYDVLLGACLAHIRHRADVCILLPGWQASKGARAEYAVARAFCRRVVMPVAPACPQCHGGGGFAMAECDACAGSGRDYAAPVLDWYRHVCVFGRREWRTITWAECNYCGDTAEVFTRGRHECVGDTDAARCPDCGQDGMAVVDEVSASIAWHSEVEPECDCEWCRTHAEVSAC